MRTPLLLGVILCLTTAVSAQPAAVPASVRFTVSNTPKPISPDLFGIFFEDLNYAADGGLYAELIQNRSFAYQPTEQLTWTATTGWEIVNRGGGKGHLAIDAALPIHPNNPQYAVLEITEPGDGVGLLNAGFDGIPVKESERYDVSLFARQLYMGRRWGGEPSLDGHPMPLKVRLEDKGGASLGEASLAVSGRDWTRLAATITATGTDSAARLVLLATARGGIAVDEISLFPQNTFHHRKNGLRDDLAQAIADLHPKFMRFPGGCLAHGSGVGNFYRWKDTIGPVEQRKGQSNLWGYHQSVGLGYFEYFQFCEDIGAKPLPVVAAGVSCQNSGYTGGTGQQCLPIADMPAYIQDILDLIEWANGPATSTWGAKRAAAGHPEPFHLQYLGVGNEDAITPGFEQRFKMIFDAVRQKHPEITVVGTVGPFPDGADFDAGWKIADGLHVPMVDEHYYESPDWFWSHLTRYNTYDRARSKVYVGEYAAHDKGRRSTLRAALAEAAHMTALERNGDVVRLASYAPLLSKRGHTQWNPDLIYFDNTTVTPSISYAVQQLFGLNSGATSLPINTLGADDHTAAQLATSCVRDTATGDVILKLVSRADAPIESTIDLTSLGPIAASATCTVLTGDPSADSPFGQPASIKPITRELKASAKLDYTIPAHSLTVIRVKRQ